MLAAKTLLGSSAPFKQLSGHFQVHCLTESNAHLYAWKLPIVLALHFPEQVLTTMAPKSVFYCKVQVVIQSAIAMILICGMTCIL
mmetsp:Transcript_59421/g.137288  ORF Transcript_59421/g.137288 Transcript_59421/m.137288 type:complete len:85 (+) Transcript_59421:96-350(+)